VLLADTDPRVGGRYRRRFRRLSGDEHECFGEYLEVSPPARLVMTWHWLGKVDELGETQITIELRPVDEGAELTLTQSGFRDETIRLGHEEG
jgi:uncharacterized protein YndB with AHSA1/START domain